MRLAAAWLALPAALLPAAGTGPALAHHSLTGVYDGTRQTELEGTVVEFRFINPHPLLMIEVGDTEGTTAVWQLEMDNRVELARIGITAASFRPGDHVRVRGIVGLTRQNALYLRRLDRPADGFWYEQRGSTPYVGNGTDQG